MFCGEKKWRGQGHVIEVIVDEQVGNERTRHKRLKHIVRHSPDGFEWGSRALMNFRVTIRAEQLEPLRILFDLSRIGMTATTLFDSAVDVMEVKGSGTSIVTATLTGIAETLLSSGYAFALALPPESFFASTTTGLPALIVIRSEFLSTNFAEAIATGIDGVANMLPIGMKELTTLRAALTMCAGSTEVSFAIGSVRDHLATLFARYLPIDPHNYSLVLMGILPERHPLIQRRIEKDDGASDLALSILTEMSDEFDKTTIERCYRGVRDKLIATVKTKGFQFSGNQIRRVVAEVLQETASLYEEVSEKDGSQTG